MSENIGKENKAIKVLFQKLMKDNYKEREYRDIFIIDVLPRRSKVNKYIDFEKNILKNNKYNVVNKFILSLSKLYLYDNSIYKLADDDSDAIRFEEYTNDLERFIDESIYNLSVPNKRMNLIFNDLKIGLEISSWSIKIMDFGCTELKLVMDMFKSEGLFVRHPYF